MTRKQHGPDLTKRVQPISRCVTCHGAGTYRGTSYEMDCPACDGAGWVLAASAKPIPEQEVTLTLCRKIRALEQQLATLQRKQTPTNSENNRRGPGASHRTGD